MDEILLVAAGQRLASAVAIALPPEEAGNLVLLRVGVVLAEFRQHFLRPGDVPVVLHAGVPVDLFRVRPLLPAFRRPFVARMNPGDAL